MKLKTVLSILLIILFFVSINAVFAETYEIQKSIIKHPANDTDIFVDLNSSFDENYITSITAKYSFSPLPTNISHFQVQTNGTPKNYTQGLLLTSNSLPIFDGFDRIAFFDTSGNCLDHYYAGKINNIDHLFYITRLPKNLKKNKTNDIYITYYNNSLCNYQNNKSWNKFFIQNPFDSDLSNPSNYPCAISNLSYYFTGNSTNVDLTYKVISSNSNSTGTGLYFSSPTRQCTISNMNISGDYL